MTRIQVQDSQAEGSGSAVAGWHTVALSYLVIRMQCVRPIRYDTMMCYS